MIEGEREEFKPSIDELLTQIDAALEAADEDAAAIRAGLAAAVLSGWLQDTDWGIENDIDDWHKWITQSVFWLTTLHITAVILVSWRVRKNLVKAMVRGR